MFFWNSLAFSMTWFRGNRVIHQSMLHHTDDYEEISSVQFSLSVVSDSLRPHGLQYARLPCPSLFPGVCSNSCPLSQWCYLTTSNYLILCCPLLLLSSVFTSIRDFSNESDLQNRWIKYWHFNFSHSNEYLMLISFKSDWLIPLQSNGLSSVYSNTTVQKHQFFGTQPSLQSNSHIHTCLLEKS